MLEADHVRAALAGPAVGRGDETDVALVAYLLGYEKGKGAGVKLTELVNALKPFARLGGMCLHEGHPPDEPMARHVPGAWPTVAALYEAKRLVEAALGKGWKDRDAGALDAQDSAATGGAPGGTAGGEG